MRQQHGRMQGSRGTAGLAGSQPTGGGLAGAGLAGASPFLFVPGSVKQGDQLNMIVFFLYLVKSDLFSVRLYSSVQWSHVLQGTRKKHVIYLFGLYYNQTESFIYWPFGGKGVI